MAAGKGNQVIKCERSEARLGSPFFSVGFADAAAELWPPRAGLGGTVEVTQRLQAAGRTTERSQLAVRVQQASHVLLKCLLPINLKSSSGWGPLSQLHALCPEASLSGGRCSGPRGRGQAQKWTRKRTGRGGQRNTTPTSKSFQIRG